MGGVVDGLGDRSGFGEQGQIGRIDFENAVQMDEAEDDAAIDRHAAAREARAGATRHHGKTGGMGKTHDFRDRSGAAGQDDADSAVLQRGGAVESIGDEVLAFDEDVFLPGDLAEACDRGGGEGGGRCGLRGGGHGPSEIAAKRGILKDGMRGDPSGIAISRVPVPTAFQGRATAGHLKLVS